MSHCLSQLPGDVERLLVHRHGIFAAADADAARISRPRLQRLEQAGLLVRLAKGVYTSRESIEKASPWQAFALRSRAFTKACGPHAHAAGWSAVAVHGLPTISPPPAMPLVVVPLGFGFSKNSTCGHIRVTTLPRDQRTAVDGCPVLSPARTVIDIARTARRDEALVVADAALARGTTIDHLRAALAVARL